MRLLSLLLSFYLLSGCEAHLISKERLFGKPDDFSNAAPESCRSAEILPVEISNKKLSNSIFWLPIIPAPWNDKEFIDKVRVKVVYSPNLAECETSDLNLISGGLVYKPQLAFLFEYENEVTRCNYEFDISSNKLDSNNSSIAFNVELCSEESHDLYYEKNTVYENHFQPW